MAPYHLSLILFLLALLCVDFGVTGKETTPRKRVDLQDDFWLHYITRPDIQAPKFDVKIYDEKALSPGYWFVAPYTSIDKSIRGKNWEGPYIYDSHGDLVWAGPPTMDYFITHDFKVSSWNNSETLTTISRRDNAGLFFNSHYELVKSVSWSPGWEHANMHEFNVIENGTRALVATRHGHTKMSIETSKTVGYDGECSVRGDGIKELDITVDPPRTLFEWIGIEHIPLKESIKGKSQELVRQRCSRNWDIHHFNSIDKFANGDYLVSSRSLDTIFKISRLDGSIVWRLGGRNSSFSFGTYAHFGAQHHARIIEENGPKLKMSVFANAGGRDWSRGLIIELDTRRMRVELVQEAAQPLKKHTGSRGSNQLLPNGNLFVCWAGYTRLSEHDPNGKLLMHAYLRRSTNTGSYRGYKFPWGKFQLRSKPFKHVIQLYEIAPGVGQPKYPPNVYSAAFALGFDGSRIITRTFVSWNGATEVARWRLYESDANGRNLKRINETARRGFETDIMVEGFAEYVKVAGLDGEGNIIGRSEIIRTLAPVKYDSSAKNKPTHYTVSDMTLEDFGSIQNQDNDLEVDNGNVEEGKSGQEVDEEDEEVIPEPVQDIDATGAVDKTWLLSVLTNPVATYVAGFVTCMTIWVGTWCSGRSRRQGLRYQPVESKEELHLFHVEDEEEREDDIELGDQMTSQKIDS